MPCVQPESDDVSIFSKLTEKSWLTPGVVGEVNDRDAGEGPAAKTALVMFMAVLSSMFLLFVVGYRMRMAEPDWTPVSDPGLLWVNSGALILASVFMHFARRAASEGQIRSVQRNLTLAGFFSIAFLVGQYTAWGILRDSGLYAIASPAAAFFMLLTGLHAVHLIGGLLVLSRATVRAWQGIEVKRIKLSVELCATYWHFLLFVWYVFFTLLLLT